MKILHALPKQLLGLFLLVPIPDWLWSFSSSRKYIFKTFRPQRLHEGVDDDEDEGDKEVEEKPDVDHLQVGGVWQAIVHLYFSFASYN